MKEYEKIILGIDPGTNILGYGLIGINKNNIELISTADDEKYFVHVSSLNGEIEENDKVSFELEKGPKGLNAVRVNKI